MTIAVVHTFEHLPAAVVKVRQALAVWIIAGMGWVCGQSPDSLRIIQFSDRGQTIELIIEDSVHTPAETFLEFTRALNDPNNPWTVLAAASFTTLSQEPFRRSTVITWPTSLRGFFRVRRGDAGADADGDGLTDDLERLLGTDPNRSDTDSDGFGDRLERESGSSPLIDLSKPRPDQVPVVSFAESASVAEEGRGFIVIPITITGRPYFGEVSVGVNGRISSASAEEPAPDYRPPPARVRAGGDRAELRIEIPDDLEIRPTRTLFIDILNTPGGGYVRGGQFTHAVRLEDNDARWVGTLRRAYGTNGPGRPQAGAVELQFGMQILRQGTQWKASLTGGVPGGAGTALIPAGTWPVQIDAFSTNRVALVTLNPIPIAETQLFGAAKLSRRLRLTVDRDSARYGFALEPQRWVGDYRLELVGGTGAQHLVGRPDEGVFILLREPPEEAPPRL